jgi:hypothetical protein
MTYIEPRPIDVYAVDAMSFTVTLHERDAIVGHGTTAQRSYVIASTDTLPHALDVLRANEVRLRDEWRMAESSHHTASGMRNEYSLTLVDRYVDREPIVKYGNVIRTMFLTIGVAK